MFTPRPLTETEQALEDACAERPMTEIIEKAMRHAEAHTDQHASSPSDDFVEAVALGAALNYAPDYTPTQVATAIARALTIRRIILSKREDVYNGHKHKGANLASYDAELSRLALIPGVMAALLDDMDAELRTQYEADPFEEDEDDPLDERL